MAGNRLNTALRPLLMLLVGLLILGAIYWNIDLLELVEVFAQSDTVWLGAALIIFIPTTLGTAWRLRVLVPPPASIRLGEATRLTLVAASLNIVLPSKMGDIAKGVFIARRGHLPTAMALSLTIYEKTCDILALLAWCVVGLMLIPSRGPLITTVAVLVLGGLLFGILALMTPLADLLLRRIALLLPVGKLARGLDGLADAWARVRVANSRRPGGALAVGIMSIGIWLLHLLQIWMFIRALGSSVPLADSLGLTPLAILVGLLPLTMAGIGTRDAALIYFYAGYFGAATGAALGLLCTLRYVIPGVAGLPWLRTGWALRAEAAAVSPAPQGSTDTGDSFESRIRW